MHRSILIVLPLATALTLACQSSTPPPPDLGARDAKWVPDAATTLARAYYSGFREARQDVIADPIVWQQAWAQLNAGSQPVPPVPAVDFGSERVVLVALGNRSSGGYAIVIDSIVSYTLGAAVYVTATSPGNTCGTTQALTQPVHIVRVTPPPEPVTFHQHNVVHQCE